MAKNLASVKPVKTRSGLNKNGRLSEIWGFGSIVVPCTLLTTARYKKLMDVVKAAQKWKDSDDGADLYALNAAIKAAEKAGAL